MNFKSKQKVHRFKDVMAFFENLSFKKFRQIEHGEKKRGSEKKHLLFGCISLHCVSLNCILCPKAISGFVFSYNKATKEMPKYAEPHTAF